MILVLLMPKKDRSWCMRIDSHAINIIIVKCHFPIPILDDMLVLLSFQRSICKTVITKTISILEINGKSPSK